MLEVETMLGIRHGYSILAALRAAPLHEDATWGRCKQGTSWCAKMSSHLFSPISRTRWSNAPLRPAKRTSLGITWEERAHAERFPLLADVPHRNLAVPALLLSAAASTGLPSPRHLVKVNLKNLKLLLVSNSGFSNLLLHISNQQKCLQIDHY